MNDKIIQATKKNDLELESLINDLHDYNNKMTKLKTFYHEQLSFLHIAHSKKLIDNKEFKEFKTQLNDIYKVHKKKINGILDDAYTLAWFQYEQSISLKNKIDYSALKIEYQSMIGAIAKNPTLTKQRINQQTKKLKQEYRKIKKPVSFKTWTIAICTIVPIAMVTILLVNYLYIIPNNNLRINGKWEIIIDKGFWTGLIVVIIASVVSIIGLFLIVKKIRKWLFIDKDQNLAIAALVGGTSTFVGTMSVGCFAVTIALISATKIIKDVKLIPGTMNVGFLIASTFSALALGSTINIDTTVLVVFTIAIMIGGFIGTRLVKIVSHKIMTLIAAIALMISFILVILVQVGVLSSGSGNGVDVRGWKIILVSVIFIFVGSLQAFGIGMTPLSIALISLLKMDFLCAILLGAFAPTLSMPIIVLAAMRSKCYSPKIAYGFLLGSIIGSLSIYLIIIVGVKTQLTFEQIRTFDYVMKWIGVAVIAYGIFMYTKRYLKFVSENRLNKRTETLIKVDNTFINKKDQALVNFDYYASKLCEYNLKRMEWIHEQIQKNNLKKRQWQ